MGRIKMQDNEAGKGRINIEQGFKEFYKQCRVKNLTERTLEYYEQCYEYFELFYGKENIVNKITKDTVDDFVLYLRANTNCNDVSLNTVLRGVRAVLYYWMRLGYIHAFKIVLLKAEKKVKVTYTDEELKLLLQKPDIKKCNFCEYRDWVIINYLIATGNRASTVTNLKIKDLDFVTATILATKTKNRNQQVIPMSKTLTKILIEYLKYRKGEPDDYLFPSVYSQKLTIGALGNAISKYNIKRGVIKTSVHLFRHTFAKNWILSGGDIFRLQKILGHKSIDIVREYVNMFGADLQRDFDRFNPLEQLSSHKQHIKL